MAAGLAIQDHTDRADGLVATKRSRATWTRVPGTCSPDKSGAPAQPCRPRPARGPSSYAFIHKQTCLVSAAVAPGRREGCA